MKKSRVDEETAGFKCALGYSQERENQPKAYQGTLKWEEGIGEHQKKEGKKRVNVGGGKCTRAAVRTHSPR